MATISLCMIVKNEEKVLARCLDSISDAVDEIIIVDTGSADSTKDIAYRYTPLVFDFKWTDDFSAARNFSFSKASMDYILWLDADDVVTKENKEKLIVLKTRLESADAVMMKYNTAFDEDGNPTFSYYRERLIRRGSFKAWRGRVHETAEYSGSPVYSEIEIHHYSVKTEYSTRNLEIYENQLADGEKLQPRDMFYYGRELYYHKKYDKAITTLSDFLNNDYGWYENKIETCKILSFCYSETGDYERAFRTLLRSFLYDNPRSETCCLIGNLLMEENRHDRAVFWFELALHIPKKDMNGGFSDTDSHGYLPCIQLCVCYDKLKDYKKAQQYNLKAGAFRPHSEAYLQNLRYFEYLHQKGVL